MRSHRLHHPRAGSGGRVLDPASQMLFQRLEQLFASYHLPPGELVLPYLQGELAELEWKPSHKLTPSSRGPWTDPEQMLREIINPLLELLEQVSVPFGTITIPVQDQRIKRLRIFVSLLAGDPLPPAYKYWD